MSKENPQDQTLGPFFFFSPWFIAMKAWTKRVIYIMKYDGFPVHEVPKERWTEEDETLTQWEAVRSSSIGGNNAKIIRF